MHPILERILSKNSIGIDTAGEYEHSFSVFPEGAIDGAHKYAP